MLKVRHKLENGKLIHEILEAEPVKKALDTQTAGEGYEWIPEDYARFPIKRVKIHQINLSEMKELKKAKFLLRRHWWKGQFVVRGMSVDHWDLVLDKGEKCLDEFAGMENNPLEQPEGVNCIRHPCCNETPERKPNKEWMNFVGKSIPPNHPEWGNPNKRIPAYMDKVDAGSVNIISDTGTFVSFMFKGKKLKGYWIAKRESPRSENWVFSKSSLPGEPRKGSQEPDLVRFKSAGIDVDLKSPRKRWRQLLADGRYLANVGYVKLKKGEPWGNWTIDAILHYFAKIIDALRSVYFPVSPPPEADKKSQTSYWKCYRASERYMKSKPPSSDEVVEWNQKRKEIILARYSREKCMDCNAPPKYEVLWAEGMARCWFCDRHFRAWALKNMKEREAEGYACDINMVREVQNGIAAERWKDNINPDIWPKLRRELS